MNINNILKEVENVTKDDHNFVLSTGVSTFRPYIFIYLVGTNHLDYEFKNGEWLIQLDWNYGHRKHLGTIKSYSKVEYKQDLWKKLPDPFKSFVEKINRVFKESLKPQSIKFITSKVKEKLRNKVKPAIVILDSKIGDDNLDVKLIQSTCGSNLLYQVQVMMDRKIKEIYNFKNIEIAQNKFDQIYKEF